MARKSRKNMPLEPEAPKPIVYAAAGYARISKESETSGDSIENQADIIRDYAKDKPDIDLKRVITTDEGYTGTDFNRPGYAELMAGILSGTVRCVIVKDLSRLGRTYIEVGELLFDTFPAYNVRFISVNDHYDSFADDAARKKLLILFKNLMNHIYSKDLANRVRSAYKMKRQRGEPNGATPYGYKLSEDGKRLAIDGDAAEIVRMVFDMRLAGSSAAGVAKHLNQTGIPTPKRRQYLLGQITDEKYSHDVSWGATSVTRILKNETYTGVLLQGTYGSGGKRNKLLPQSQWIRHEEAHQAIISREQFDTVQALVGEAAERCRRICYVVPENAYVGKISCSLCGKNVQRKIGGNSRKRIYYYGCSRCADELRLERGLKTVPTMPLAKLDGLVAATLRVQTDLLVEYDQLMEDVARSGILRQKRSALICEISALEKEAASADRTIEAAYKHHLDGLLDFREYELVREKALMKKDETSARLSYVEGELRRLDGKNAESNLLRQQFSAFRTFDAPTKEIVQALIKRITLTPLTNDVVIELNYMDSLAELHGLVDESGVASNA